jgi:hypothetical protein
MFAVGLICVFGLFTFGLGCIFGVKLCIKRIHDLEDREIDLFGKILSLQRFIKKCSVPIDSHWVEQIKFRNLNN